MAMRPSHALNPYKNSNQIEQLIFAQRLKGSFTEEQAHRLSDVLKQVDKSRADDFVAKADIQDIRSEIKLVETRLNGRIDNLETKLSAQSRLHFIVLLFVIIVSNPKALELISKMLGIVK